MAAAMAEAPLAEAVAIRVVVHQEAVAVVPVEAVAAEDLTAAVPPAAALPAGIPPVAPRAAGKLVEAEQQAEWRGLPPPEGRSSF